MERVGTLSRASVSQRCRSEIWSSASLDVHRFIQNVASGDVTGKIAFKEEERVALTEDKLFSEDELATCSRCVEGLLMVRKKWDARPCG